MVSMLAPTHRITQGLLRTCHTPSSSVKTPVSDADFPACESDTILQTPPPYIISQAFVLDKNLNEGKETKLSKEDHKEVER